MTPTHGALRPHPSQRAIPLPRRRLRSRTICAARQTGPLLSFSCERETTSERRKNFAEGCRPASVPEPLVSNLLAPPQETCKAALRSDHRSRGPAVRSTTTMGLCQEEDPLPRSQTGKCEPPHFDEPQREENPLNEDIDFEKLPVRIDSRQRWVRKGASESEARHRIMWLESEHDVMTPGPIPRNSNGLREARVGPTHISYRQRNVLVRGARRWREPSPRTSGAVQTVRREASSRRHCHGQGRV